MENIMNYKSRMSYLEIEPVHERNWKEEKNVLVWICERDKIWKKAQNKHDKIQREKKGKEKRYCYITDLSATERYRFILK